MPLPGNTRGFPRSRAGTELVCPWFPILAPSDPRDPPRFLRDCRQLRLAEFPALLERDRETGGCWGDLVALGTLGSLVADQGSLVTDQGSFLVVDQELQPFHELWRVRGRELGLEDQRGD